MIVWLLACTPAEVTLDLVLTNNGTAEQQVKFGPAAVIVGEVLLASEGSVATPELESLAEDGDPQALVDRYGGQVLAVEDQETYEAAAMLPGQTATERITVPTDASVTILFMFGESNDTFYANRLPIAVWGHGANVGDWSSRLGMWDAGTEVNEEIGVGPNQAPRQEEPGQGTPEDGLILPVLGPDAFGYTFPPVGSVVSLVAELPPEAD